MPKKIKAEKKQRGLNIRGLVQWEDDMSKHASIVRTAVAVVAITLFTIAGCTTLPQATPPYGEGLDKAYDQIQTQVRTTAIDAPLISVELRLSNTPPTQPGEQGTVEISLTSRMDIDSVALDISLAGAVKAEPPHGFSTLAPIAPYVKDLQPSDHFRIEFDALKAEQVRTFSFTFIPFEQGRGYILATATSPAQGKDLRVAETATLFLLASPEGVFFSEHSFLDVDIQQLRRSLIKKGESEESIEKQIERLKRGGADTKKKLLPPNKTRPPAKEPGNSITVQGQMRFTDVNGATHSVRFVTVQIWDEEEGADEMVTTTTTDANGEYSVTVDDIDGDGTGRDIYVRAQAQGDTVRVQDIATSNVWEIDSLPAIADVPDGSTVVIDLTANNNIAANPNNVAFEAYEAANYLSRYLTDLGEPLPPLITINYPGGGDGSSYNPPTQTMTLAGTDVHDWDNIQHEYSHHLQDVYNIANNPGGAHSSASNLCITRASKDVGTRLAWAEAWATAFAITAQSEMGLAALGIPNLADTNYTDTKPAGADLDFDLEVEDGVSKGEGNERAIMRTYWDLYDTVDDGDDVGVAVSAQDLWDAVVDSQPVSFSEFWNALVFSRTEQDKVDFGAITAQHNISPEMTAPPDGTVFAGGATPTFQWDGNMGCDTGGNARYSVRFYDNSLTSLIWASPWQSATSITPTNSQRDSIFVGPDAALPWAVASKDLSAPETGVYYGNSRTIVDDYDAPDRSPVDIILALDISGSMGGVVPGSTTGLKKIELLQQAAEVFVRTWAMHAVDGDRIGVVYFSTNTSSLPTATPVLMDVASNADAVVGNVNGKSAGGCTAIGGALQVGFAGFDTTSTNKRVIILFTDGEQTVNPFVDEEGTPTRLRIRVIPVGGSLPFDAYWCSTSTAQAPDGTVIVPDGLILGDHNTQVHTIGVGPAGATFEDLIERISDETDALHHFTSAPDEELDIFFTNDLVSSLKTGSLQMIKAENGTIARTATKTIRVPVNTTAKSLTFALSWKGELNENALNVSAISPGGVTLIPSKVSEGAFFKINNFALPLADGVRHSGNWTVRIQSGSDVPTLNYQFSAIADEPCFRYQLDFPRQDYATGDQIWLTTTLTQNGQPLANADAVNVHVTRPAVAVGNLLSQWVPHVSKADLVKAKSLRMRNNPDLSMDKRIAAVYMNPTFVSLANAKNSFTVRLFDDGRQDHGDLKAGDGIYSNVLATTQIPGNYNFALEVQALSLCGRLARTETTSTLVQIKSFNAAKSRIRVTPLRKTFWGRVLYAVDITPVDDFGNLLGPGHADQIQISLKGGNVKGKVMDRLDGTYRQFITMKNGDNPRLTVLVGSKSLMHAPIRALDVKALSVSKPASSVTINK
jgi:hypothetical protein